MVETVAVYPVHRAPDGPLRRIKAALADAGFTVQPAEELDIAARRGIDRLFLGIGPHPEGTVVRWKAKSLIPGRTGDVERLVKRVLAQTMGEPARELDPGRQRP